MANSAYTPTFNLSDGSATEQKLAAGATLKLGTEQATTSGTSIDFTGIPAGTKQIIVMLDSVSTNGSSNIILQLGDSGGIETTGYLGSITYLITSGAVAVSQVTNGIYATSTGAATNTALGAIILTRMDDSHTWIAVGSTWEETNQANVIQQKKILSSELDRIRLTSSNGTDTFDAGSINIAYK